MASERPGMRGGCCAKVGLIDPGRVPLVAALVTRGGGSGVVTRRGAVSGPCSGDLVAVQLGQVVGCHQ